MLDPAIKIWIDHSAEKPLGGTRQHGESYDRDCHDIGMDKVRLRVPPRKNEARYGYRKGRDYSHSDAIGEAAANEDTKIHQSVANDGVTNKRYKRKSEVRTEPTERGPTCCDRQQEIRAYGAGAKNEKANPEMLQLSPGLTPFTAPFRDKDSQCGDHAGQKIDCEEWEK